MNQEEKKKAIEVAGLLLMYEMGWTPGRPDVWQINLKKKLLEIYPDAPDGDLEWVAFEAENYTHKTIKAACRAAYDARLKSDQLLRDISNRRNR